MKISGKTQSYRLVKKWGEHYREKSESVLQASDANAVRDFRQELSAFVASVERRWLGKRKHSLKAEKREWLEGLCRDLRQLELRLANRMLGIEKDRSVLRRMEEVALPESTGDVTERPYSLWSAWAIRISDRTRAKLASARLPQ